MSRRTGGGRLTAATELIVSDTAKVPFWFWKTVGSTRTCTTAGVIPEEGEMVTPWVLVESWKSVLPPPGSVMAMVWIITLRSQTVPRATTSRTLATPRPVTFSGIEKLSLTSRFSASRMDRTGGAACTAGEDGEEPVEVVAETVGIC